MDANAVGEIERRRDSFKADPLHYLKRHRELKSLIVSEPSLSQGRVASLFSMYVVLGFHVPKNIGFSA